jgi:hypothetical protein
LPCTRALLHRPLLRKLLVVLALTACSGSKDAPPSKHDAASLRMSQDLVDAPSPIDASPTDAISKILGDIELVTRTADRTQIDLTPCTDTKDTRCMRCTLADPRPLDVGFYGELGRGLEMSPRSFWKAAGLERVILCTELAYLDPDLSRPPQATVDFARRELLVSTSMVRADNKGTTQHELYHLFDKLGWDDRAWSALNTKTFKYGSTTPSRGFVRAYSMKNVVEDKATVYEAIIGGRFCLLAEHDTIILAKGKLVRDRIRAAIGDDAEYLDTLAPCLGAKTK